MKTAEKNANAQGAKAEAKGTTNRVENRPSLTGKEAKQDEKAANQNTAETKEIKDGKTAEATPGSAPAVGHQSANPANEQTGQGLNGQQQAGEPKAEEFQEKAPKGEIRYIKPPRNVEATIKEVEALHRRSIQRLNLITRKKQLETFEVALTQEADELNDNPFQGCKLIIKDDKNREFVTTTPGLIRLVTQFIYDACDTKLAEIEAKIVFPENL